MRNLLSLCVALSATLSSFLSAHAQSSFIVGGCNIVQQNITVKEGGVLINE